MIQQYNHLYSQLQKSFPSPTHYWLNNDIYAIESRETAQISNYCHLLIKICMLYIPDILNFIVYGGHIKWIKRKDFCKWLYNSNRAMIFFNEILKF